MNKYHGVYTALVTPFIDGEVDYSSLEKLTLWQIEQGVHGFVVHGTTGESPTVLDEEKEKIFKFIKKITEGKVPLIVGTGSNSTSHTIQATRLAEKWGADAALVVVPYYNKPPQRGLLAHFNKVAESSELPIILYNVPGRTITSLSVETVVELSQNKKIIGIKEASGQIELLKELKQKSRNDFVFLSGDDGTYVDFLKEGGHGVISVTSHLFPKIMRKCWDLAQEKKWSEAKDIFLPMDKLTQLLFCEANPIPVKKGLQLIQIIKKAELRLPLTELSENYSHQLHSEMKKVGILK
jgi:4-hydroxy-tetrahydrodipicolinate synthase